MLTSKDHRPAKERIEDVEESDFVWSIVRNPYERLISWYHFLRMSNKTDPNPVIESAINDDINTWVPFALHGDHGYKFRDTPVFKPQVEYLMVDGELVVDKICRFENYKEDVGSVLEYLGFERNMLDRVHAFETDHPLSYDNYLSDETIEMITEYFEEDFKIFGYKIENS